MVKHKQNNQWQRDEQVWSDLMKQAQAGNKKAYELLLVELGAVIEVYIKAKFGVFPLLEDCVQECLLTLHNVRHTYDASRAFRPWMFTIVQHKTIDVLRRRDSAKNKIDGDSAAANVSEYDLSALERLMDGERLISELPKEQREAITLTKYIGMTTEEAAKLVGVNESAMKARLRRGLKKVQQQWKREWLHDE